MMKTAITISFFLIYTSLFANKDSLIVYSDLDSTSNLEENCFRKLANGRKVNYLQFFISSDEGITKYQYQQWQKRFDYVTNQVKLKFNPKKKPAKNIKKIYKEVHDSYCQKYTMNTDFSDLFKDGSYNCVSGTAIYALIFEELDIPYSIKEVPTHVYLVAYPETENIYVEATDPIF